MQDKNNYELDNRKVVVDEVLDNLLKKIEENSYQIRQSDVANSTSKGMSIQGIKQAIEEARLEFYAKNKPYVENEIYNINKEIYCNEHRTLITNAFLKLMDCFPKGRLLSDRDPCEFLAHDRGNIYFILGNCETQMDVDCKVLEWFSRAAYKATPFVSDIANHRFHEYFRSGISKYFDHEFDTNEIELVYTKLGNSYNHKKTVAFVQSGFDMTVLDPNYEGKYEHENTIDI